MKALTLAQRRQLLCLSAASGGPLANLRLAVERAGCALTPDVLAAAAGAGQLEACQVLVYELHCPGSPDAISAAARGGHLPCVSWLLRLLAAATPAPPTTSPATSSAPAAPPRPPQLSADVLSAAAEAGQALASELLLRSGACVPTEESVCAALRGGHVSLAERLLCELRASASRRRRQRQLEGNDPLEAQEAQEGQGPEEEEEAEQEGLATADWGGAWAPLGEAELGDLGRALARRGHRALLEALEAAAAGCDLPSLQRLYRAWVPPPAAAAAGAGAAAAANAAAAAAAGPEDLWAGGAGHLVGLGELMPPPPFINPNPNPNPGQGPALVPMAFFLANQLAAAPPAGLAAAQAFVLGEGAKGSMVAAAAASPTPDWQAKVDWLLGPPCFAPPTPAVARAAAAEPDALPRLTWLLRERAFPSSELLLREGAAVDGGTANLAAFSGHVGVLRVLEERSQAGLVRGPTLLALAAVGGHLHALQYLVERARAEALAQALLLAQVEAVLGPFPLAPPPPQPQPQPHAPAPAAPAAGPEAEPELAPPQAEGHGAAAGEDLAMGRQAPAADGDGGNQDPDPVPAGADVAAAADEVGAGAMVGAAAAAVVAAAQALPTLTSGVFSAAASAGKVALVRWLREVGCPWDPVAYETAAHAGSQELAEWLAENGCPMGEDGEPYVRAARNGDVAMMACLRRLGVPWSPSGATFTRALSDSRCELPALVWLREAGVPVDWTAVGGAAEVLRRRGEAASDLAVWLATEERACGGGGGGGAAGMEVEAEAAGEGVEAL
ncbi:hypothetical protein HYH03_006463 [Edaphochlamys debaryana]|uniref:Uncharacterized protein n=1 Tax=Edaphochlamys debaryana TaxID=47281 RepID=A0A836C0A6_9CHLO|nr:hypothetical protein HYH03_006463 [Edaphochlamys debaryana]|eukprot:KAG2495520.1 hypothetical protein HYH03_006463 [Edaphochlamys debaryana]